MMKLFKFGLVSLALSLCIGSGVFLLKGQKAPTKVEAAAVSILNPTFINDYQNLNGQNWSSNEDPSDGQSSDVNTYKNALKSTTSGFTNYSVFTITTHESSNVSDASYIQAASSSTDDFLAQYVPAHMEFVVAPYTKVTYSLTFRLSAYRSKTGNNASTRADFSTEFFWYGETVQTPTTWFYHSNDFTTSTGRGYSQYRVADEVPGNTASHDVVKSFTFENNASSEVTKKVYFGMFCYIESSGKTGNYTGKLSVISSTKDVSNAVASVNGTNYYTSTTALSAYNAASNSTMTLISDLDFSASHYSLSSAGGTVNLVNHTINLANRVLYIAADTTITGSSGGKVTSTFAYGTIAINAAAVLTLSGYAKIENTCTDTATARAVLLGNANAKIFVEENAQVISNYYGIQNDNGYIYCSGKIISNNSSYAIYVGSSDEANKYIFLYGSNVQALKVRINNLAKTYFYAAFNSTSYSSATGVDIELNTYTIGSIVVRNVNNSNYSKFSILQVNYRLSKSSTNMIVAYRERSVTYTLTNLSSNGPATCTIGSDLSFTISPNSGYVLPNAITVRVGTTTLSQNTDYTYNSSTGAVVINKENLTSDVTITASGVVQHTVTFVDENGQAAEPIVVKGTQSIHLPDSDNEPAYHHTTWFENPEFTGSAYTPNSLYQISSDMTFYARYTQDSRDVVLQFVGIELHFDVDVISTSNVSDTGACRGETGYYEVAKAKYLSLNNAQKKIFCEYSEFATARARFIAWANANGEDINLSTYAIVQQSSKIVPANDSSDTVNIVIIISAVSLLSFVALIVIKRKKKSSN